MKNCLLFGRVNIVLLLSAAVSLLGACKNNVPVVPDEGVDFATVLATVNECRSESNFVVAVDESADSIVVCLARDNRQIALSKEDAQLITTSLPSPIDSKAVESLLPDDYATQGKLLIVNTGRDLRLFAPDGSKAVLGSDINIAYNPPLPTVGEGQTLNVLMIGNSLTSDTAEHLPRILADMNIDNVNISEIYHGGFTLQQHNAYFDLNNKCCHYIYSAGDADWTEFDPTALDDCAAEVLATRTWDIVTIQEHTGDAAAWSWTDQEKAAIMAIINRIYAAQPTHRPTLVYLLSHVYGKRFYKDTTLWDWFDGDQNKMYETCLERIPHILAETPIDRYLSNATAVQNLRTSTLNKTHPLDLSRDCIHSDYGITRFCESATFFQSVLAPCLGRDISESTYTYSKSDSRPGYYTTPVTDENRMVAIEAAKYAVAEPLKITRMSPEEPEPEVVSYVWRLCDNLITLSDGVDFTVSNAGTPSGIEWTVSGTGCGKASMPMVQSGTNNRYKIGTGGDYISPFVLKTSALADKQINKITVCASMASADYTAHVKATVGSTTYVDSDVALSTTDVKLTGHPYTGYGSASGDIVVEITNNGPFFIYTVTVEYQQ